MAAARSADRDQTCDASPWTARVPRGRSLLQGKNRRSGRLTGPGGRSSPRATIKPMHASRGRKEDGSRRVPPPISSARHQITPPSPSGLLAGLAYTQVRPPNYSPDRLPETSFTCEDKVSGSYYADVEASCQLFHVCVQVSELEVKQDIVCLISFGLTSSNLSSSHSIAITYFNWSRIPLISIWPWRLPVPNFNPLSVPGLPLPLPE